MLHVSEVVGNRVTTEQGDVVVVRASPYDAVAILRLRDALASWMVDRGIDQWRPGEMPLPWIEVCAAQGWVVTAPRDDNLVGSLTLVWADPLIWGDRNEPAGYIHMLMVDRIYAHLGLGRSLLDWAEGRITRAGHRRARLDCVRTNVALRDYYENAGYVLVGYREFAEGIPSVALYEKALA
jgi:GNAT superfamily N-acetyltransferase